MNSLRKPYWVFLASTGPVLLFMLLSYGEFSVVRTLLPPDSLARWGQFGAAMGGMALATAGYAALQLWRRQPLGIIFCVAQLLGYSLLLCLLTWQSDDLLPFSIPRWMVPTDLVLMAWTFLMPTLAHALIALVARFTPDDQPQHALPNIGLAVAMPIAWVIVGWMLSGLSELLTWSGAGVALCVTAAVLSTLSFFFFLVRAVYIVVQRRSPFWSDTGLLWAVIISIVLPVLGLAVNSGLFFGGLGKGGIFGNFTSPWFYILAVLNGGLLCLPSPARPLPRLLLFVGRSVLFGYTLYFFLVFLPFLPLSIPAILLIGTGFLLLAPVLLFVLHLRQLSADIAALRAFYPKAAVTAALVAGLVALPLYITADYWHSRRTLHVALAYVYTPDYSRAYQLDTERLAATLAVVRQHKDRSPDFLSGQQLPYLSAYFNWLVLDNLMLSERKLDDLEQIFQGKTEPQETVISHVPAPQFGGAVLRNAEASSHYDARQQAWVSWLNLELANSDPSETQGEYSTSIALPAGCWVSDYYLTIGKRQERGILAEKRAATWVFAQVLNERRSRDPGLLYYLGPNTVGLRVYPIIGGEVRRTRVQLLHKEPCELTIDGRTVALGTAGTVPPLTSPVTTPAAVYLSALAKQSLPLVHRRPYYHFLLDAAARPSQASTPDYEGRIRQVLGKPLANGDAARFSLVTAYHTPLPAGADWQQALSQVPRTGGCNLTGALQRVLFEARQHPRAAYPVLVFVTDNWRKAVLADDFAGFSSAYPESEVFYVLGADGQLEPHSLRRQSRQPLADAPPPGTAPAVRAWPTAAQPQAYLPDNNLADIVPAGRPAVPHAPAASRWLDGLQLEAYHEWQTFHPETTNQQQVAFIQASFRAGILTPATSYLALENEAQKAALYRKQQQTLAANASLDTLEENELPPVETPIDGGVGLLLVAGLMLAGWQLRRSTNS